MRCEDIHAADGSGKDAIVEVVSIPLVEQFGFKFYIATSLSVVVCKCVRVERDSV